ncbi:MAG: hypothetical protein ACYDBJ_02440 [Aggregatilineales bacterium]
MLNRQTLLSTTRTMVISACLMTIIALIGGCQNSPTLPDAAKQALDKYIRDHGGMFLGTPAYQIINVEKATSPQYGTEEVARSEEIYCAKIDPPIHENPAVGEATYSHFEIGRTGNLWSVRFPDPDGFEGGNWLLSGASKT